MHTEYLQKDILTISDDTLTFGYFHIDTLSSEVFFVFYWNTSSFPSFFLQPDEFIERIWLINANIFCSSERHVMAKDSSIIMLMECWLWQSYFLSFYEGYTCNRILRCIPHKFILIVSRIGLGYWENISKIELLLYTGS
jgi:hypothetical protein